MSNNLLLVAALLTGTYVVAYLTRAWSSGHLASPSALYAGLTALHFAVPGVLLGIGEISEFSFVNPDNASYAVEAMFFVLFALIAFQSGALLVDANLLATMIARRHKPAANWRVGAARVGVALFVLVGVGARIHIIQSNAYFQIVRTTQGALEGPFYAAIRIAEQFPMYALCILAILFWRPREQSNSNLKLGFALVWALEILYWLPSGRKEPVVLAVVLPLLIRYLRNGRLPSLLSIGLLALIGFLWFPVSFAYRNAMQSTRIQAGPVDTVVAAVELAKSETIASQARGGTLLSRLALLESVSACVRLVSEGDWKPMLGLSYAQGLLGFIPRLLWPGKPDMHYGTEFGHAAGFLSPDDWATSISVTYYGEAFLNLGWFGLLAIHGMGVLSGLLYRQMARSAHRETWLFVYSLALPSLLYAGGTFALTFAGLIKILPFGYLAGRLIEAPVGKYMIDATYSAAAHRH